MKITTNGCAETKEELEQSTFYACGIATVHSDGKDWIADSTYTMKADGAFDIPYTVKSGETFNVIWTDSTPTTYLFQPQTATHIFLPLDFDFFNEYKEIWDHTSKMGIDVLVWNDPTTRPLVTIE